MAIKRSAPCDSRPPIAVSYLRFSSPEQRKGDSHRRQTEDTEKWCARNGIPLDQKLSSCGSAFRGKHRSDIEALGQFLGLVKHGQVPRGSYLIIENLDRLSREEERPALRLWLDILDAGINIVQLYPETIFRHERSDLPDILRAIIELSRGHSESRMKSVRSLANWEKALRKARENGRPFTQRLPSWIEMKNDQLCLIRFRVKAIRRIFALAQAGYGMASIVKALIREQVRPFGFREPDENGGTRHVDGERYGCGEWRTSYIRSILSDRRILGEFQPCDRDGHAKGEPIAGYYPACITEAEFFAARAAVLSRRTKQGRIGKDVANLFGGLLRNARDGSTYYVAVRSEKGVTSRTLLNASSVEQKARAYTFPYAVFEKSVLELLCEIDPASILECADEPPDVAVVKKELEFVKNQQATLLAEMAKGNIPAFAKVLRQLNEREEELKKQLRDLQTELALPAEQVWRDAKNLVELQEQADDLNDVRLRLRAALRRLVEEVWVLVVPKGRDRLAALQIFFRGDTAGEVRRRDYLIYFKAGLANAVMRRKADSWCVSLASVAQPDDLDLRKPEHARQLEVLLSALDLEALQE
jgi:DNA invertase Pin-like site-specific DNA recombinase